MKKFTMLLALLVFIMVQAANAQNRKITGTVTSSEDGSTMPGVSVVAKGTTIGTITDLDGKFVLEVPADTKALVFTFVGMKTVEVMLGADNVVNVTLEPDVKQVEEVVVTALGITRQKKALGYAVQEVKGDDLTKGKEPNISNALSGRVAGVTVTSSSGAMGGSSKVLLRGVRSILGNNGPLYVIDGVPISSLDYNSANTARGGGGYDYGNMAQDINPEDVESISVLKGANAAALYGSRASNGVILITTKKGKGKKGIGVTVNSSVIWEKVALLPKYQNRYGGGYELTPVDITNEITGETRTYNVPNYDIDESWGPKYDPNLMHLPWNAFDPWDTKNYLVEKPWVAPKNDVKDFFDTGVTYSNNVAIAGSDDNSDFRLSYTNLNTKGYMPNSELIKHTISFNGSQHFTKKVKAFSSVNYVKTSARGRSETGYGDNNIMVRFNQWGQRQLDTKEMKAYKNPDGTQRTWNRIAWDDPRPMYSNNPYWSLYEDYQNDVRDRVFGNVGASVHIFDWLKLQGKLNLDHYTFTVHERIAVGSAFQPSYTLTTREFTELNKELLLMANKNLTDFISLSATFGFNFMDRKTALTGGFTNNGLNNPGIYNLNNSVAPATAYDSKTEKMVNSILGSFSLGFYNMFFLEGTFRNDFASTLPSDNWSYLYPSITGNFIFTELEPLKDNMYINFGKVRASWAKVGSDTDPYQLEATFALNSPFGNNSSANLPTTMPNSKLKPEFTTAIEVGTELKFYNNRFGLDVSYYNYKSTDQIIDMAVSPATGFRRVWINAGELRNKGVEIQLYAQPVKMDNSFEWEIGINYAKNKNELVELLDSKDPNERYLLGSIFGFEVHAEEGKPYGSLRSYDYVKDNQGNIIVGTNGRTLNGSVKTLGSYLPDFKMGITNAFRFKGIELSALIDIQKGGKMLSLTNMWGTYSGILEETAIDSMRENGVIENGVYGRLLADGSIEYLNADGSHSDVPVKNTTVISAERWAADYYSRARGAKNIFSTDYIRLRELRISYNVPAKFTGPIKGLNVGVFGRNLALWGTDNKHIDPEVATSSGNIQGIEGGQLPSLRNFGINLTFTF